MNEFITGNNIDVLNAMPEASIDLIVTSPPYGDMRSYNGYTFDYKATGHAMYRVLKNGGVCVWVVNDKVINGSKSLTSFKTAIHFVDECGFRLHDTMIWHKGGLPSSGNRYNQIFEYMLVFSKGNPKAFNPIMVKSGYSGRILNPVIESIRGAYLEEKSNAVSLRKKKTVVNPTKVDDNVWRILTGHGRLTDDDIAYNHPAIFPEELAKRHIISWSNKGDIVLDPFSGSGTTCKMAYLLQRQYIGIDISEEYNQIARQRLAMCNMPLPI
jgi:site-specific DNA-methyltransferase (adenine-specific)